MTKSSSLPNTHTLTDAAETLKLQRIAERQKSFQAKYKKTLSKMEAENEAKVKTVMRGFAVMRF